MAVYFSPSVPICNRVEDYDRLEKIKPALWEDFPEDVRSSKNIDQLDWILLTEAHRHFADIFHCDEICILWARSFCRLSFVYDEPKEQEYQGDWPYKQQSCTSLAKKSISLLSTETENAELVPLLKICKQASLFFRKISRDLEFLYRQMPEVEYLDELHLFQRAPHPSFPSVGLPRPPKSLWSHPGSWTVEDWSTGHCTGWDHFLSIARGILANAAMTIKPHIGLQEKLSFWERVCRHDWKSGLAPLQGIGRAFEAKVKNPCGNPMKKEDYSVNFSPSEFYSDPRRSDSLPLIDTGPKTIIYLIQAGIDPFAVFDVSEIVTGQSTQWRVGASSPEYISLVHLACEFGTKEILEALLEAGDLREYYRTNKLKDTPYQRAVMNYARPSVLVPFLEAAAKYPNEPLNQEIQSFSKEGEKRSFLWKPLARFAADEVWRRRPCNYLLLACVSGDLVFAKYLVEKVEAEARAACGDQATEKEKEVAAALAASAFVNRPGDNFSPEGSPVQIASRSAQAEIVSFLCVKGAQASLEIRVQATQRLNSRMINVVSQWEEVQEQIRNEIDLLRLEVNQQQLDEMTSIAIAYHNNVAAEKQTLQSCSAVSKSNHEIIDRMLHVMALIDENHKPVIEFYRKNHGLISSVTTIADSKPFSQTRITA
jgi:hypothetical protein